MKARRILIGLIALLIVAVGGGYVYARSQQPMLDLAVGYGARVACGCRFIGNRPLADCTRDFEPGMGLVQLEEDSAAKSVTASIPLFAQRTARLDPVLGCQLDPYRK